MQKNTLTGKHIAQFTGIKGIELQMTKLQKKKKSVSDCYSFFITE